MLPKPEKNSKKSSEQLDLVDTIDEADTTKKKRFLIILSLFLTVGISLCFIFYRQFKNVNFKSFSLPNFSQKFSTITQPKFSPTVPPSWSIFVQSVGVTSFTYSSNQDFLPDFNQIKTIHNPPYAKKYLPDGVVILEKTNSTTNYLEIFSEVSTPKIKFKIYTKIPSKIDSNSPEIDIFSRLAETFYWHLLK